MIDYPFIPFNLSRPVTVTPTNPTYASVSSPQHP